MLVLDTDVLTILQSEFGDAFDSLVEFLDVSDDDVYVTVISLEEQMRGWLSLIAKAKSVDRNREWRRAGDAEPSRFPKSTGIASGQLARLSALNILPRMDDSLRKSLVPGARVTVTQQIPHRDRVWTNKISGTILEYSQKTTGSWFAHSKDDKLWLDRLSIKRDDGELLTLNLDDYSHVEVAAAAAEAEKPAGE